MASDVTTLLGIEPAPHPEGCDGYGRVSLPDGTAAHCPGCANRKLIRAVAAFIPPRHRTAVTLAPEVANWVSRGAGADGLYLSGPIGSGKTCTAYAAAAHWCLVTGTRPTDGRHDETYGERVWLRPTVVFVRATSLFDELRAGGDVTRQRIADLQQAELLVIDDLGAEKPSEWTAEKLYEVVDERYAQERPVIVTSNVPPGKLGEHIGNDRVASRFAEMCTVVAMTGADRRRS